MGQQSACQKGFTSPLRGQFTILPRLPDKLCTLGFATKVGMFQQRHFDMWPMAMFQTGPVEV